MTTPRASRSAVGRRCNFVLSACALLLGVVTLSCAAPVKCSDISANRSICCAGKHCEVLTRGARR